MSFEQLVQDHHKLQFNDAFMLATQQKGSKLRAHVHHQSCSGEGSVAADVIGESNYQRGTGRRRSNIETPPPRTRRWLTYRDPIEWGMYFDNEDKFRQMGQPDSMLMQSGALAIGRGVDDTILGLNPDGTLDIGGLYGPVTEGKRPEGTADFPAANRTVHGGTGLNVSKLRAARRKLGLDENDLDMLTPKMAITTNQHDDLLGIVESASANLNMLEQPQIVEGKVKRLMGFEFIEINRLLKDGTTRSCPVWLEDHVVLGCWQDVKTDMWNDTHTRNTPYGHVDAYMDATRAKDSGIHLIECAEL